MGTSDTDFVVRISDSLEEDEELLRSMRELKLLPRYVRPAVRARFVHQLSESPPLSELAEVVERARARCAERIKDQSEEPSASISYSLEWDLTIEVDAEPVGQVQCNLDIEFDALQLWRSLRTTDGAGGSEAVPAELSLSVCVGASAISSETPSLQYGPWSYPS